jgi:transporter family protein
MTLPAALKAKWIWVSALCVFSWGAWILCSKLGSNEIPADAMEFIFGFGFLFVAVFAVLPKKVRWEKSPKGISYSIANGVLSGIGGLALFAAYRSGGNTTVITVATGLYPLITVLLAIVLLRERLNALQLLGLVFAVAALVIFSF